MVTNPILYLHAYFFSAHQSQQLYELLKESLQDFNHHEISDKNENRQQMAFWIIQEQANWIFCNRTLKLEGHKFQLSYWRGYEVGFWFEATKIMCYFNLWFIQQLYMKKKIDVNCRVALPHGFRSKKMMWTLVLYLSVKGTATH